MKTYISVGVVIAGLTVGCVLLAREARIERALARELIEQRLDQENQIGVLKAELEKAKLEQTRLRDQLAATDGDAVAKRDDKPKSTRAAKVDNTAAASPPPTADSTLPAKPSAKYPFTLPERKQAQQAHARGMVQQEYGQLFESIDLSASEKESLLELLTAEVTGARPGVDPAEYKAQRAERLREMLGQEKAAAVEQYEGTLRERIAVREMARQLELRGASMTEQQRNDLITVLFAERQRQPAPADLYQIATIDDLRSQMVWLDDYDRRVLTGAQSILADKQRRQLQAIFVQRAEKRAHVFEAKRKEAEAGGRPLLSWPVF